MTLTAAKEQMIYQYSIFYIHSAKSSIGKTVSSTSSLEISDFLYEQFQVSSNVNAFYWMLWLSYTKVWSSLVYIYVYKKINTSMHA